MHFLPRGAAAVAPRRSRPVALAGMVVAMALTLAVVALTGPAGAVASDGSIQASAAKTKQIAPNLQQLRAQFEELRAALERLHDRDSYIHLADRLEQGRAFGGPRESVLPSTAAIVLDPWPQTGRVTHRCTKSHPYIKGITTRRALPGKMRKSKSITYKVQPITSQKSVDIVYYAHHKKGFRTAKFYYECSKTPKKLWWLQ